MEETEEGLERRAYSLGLQLKNSNLDTETIYAKLEKQGIPEELAIRVANDIALERNKSKEEKSFDYIAWIKIVGGISGILIILFFAPRITFIPAGLLIGGILYFVMKKKK